MSLVVSYSKACCWDIVDCINKQLNHNICKRFVETLLETTMIKNSLVSEILLLFNLNQNILEPG